MPTPYEKIADAFITSTGEVRSLFAPPPKPETETPFTEYYQKKREPVPDFRQTYLQQVSPLASAQAGVTEGDISALQKIATGAEWAFSPFAVAGQAVLEPFTERKGETKRRRETLYELRQANLKLLQDKKITKEQFKQTGKEITDIAVAWERAKFPGGEAFAKYRNRPLWQQLLSEAPAWVATSVLGLTATGLRGALAPAAQAGKLPAQVGRAALAPLAAAEAAPGVVLKYGLVWPVRQVAVKGVAPALRKSLEMALDTGLDKWLAIQGIRGDNANKVVAYFLKKNNRWLFEQAKNSVLKKRAGVTMTQRATAAADETILQAEPKLLAAIKGSGIKPAEVAPVKPPVTPVVSPVAKPPVVPPTVPPPPPSPPALVGEPPLVVAPKPTIDLEPLRDIPIGTMSPDIIEEFGFKGTVAKLKRLQGHKNLPLEYKTRLNDVVGAYDLKFRTPKTLDRRRELLAHLDKIKVEGGEIDIPPEYIDIASKISLKDLTPNQLNQIYEEANAVVQQGLLKNKLIKVQAKRRVNNAVDELVGQLGKPPKPPSVITAEALKRDFPTAIKEKSQSFFTRTYRQERVLRDLDGYADGPLTNMIYKPINEAKDSFLFERIGGNEELKKVIKDNNIDFAKIINSKQTFTGDVILTPEEKIGVYLSSLNPDNMLHLKYGNKFSEGLVAEVVDSLTPEEKLLADFLYSRFNDPIKVAELSKVRTQVEGKPVTPVKDYFPIRLEWKADPEFNAANLMAKEEIYRHTAKWASSGIPKGFVKTRTHKAIQPVNLKAFEIYDGNLSLTSHYKAFAPVVRDLQLIINNAKFKAAYKARVGDSGYAVLHRWLKQVAEADPLRAANQGEKVGRFLRTNAVTAVLGFNITTSLKQFPSFFGGMAEAGVVPVMKGLTTFIRHPKETLELVKELSPQIHVRTMERELAEAKVLRNIDKRISGKMSRKEVFMILTTSMDRFVVNSIWRGAYDDGLKKGMTRIKAAKYAEAIIRKTQPFFDVKDLPEFWRSGELMKALTMFTNQLNQYWNYYKFDIYGARKAGKISNSETLKRIILMCILPALTIGAITKSSLPKDAEDVAEDVAGMGLATVPVFGSWMSAGLRGWRSSGIITTEIMETIRDITYYASEGNMGKVALQIPELVAYATGIPYGQPKRTVEAMLDLAQGKSDDWLSLIWGKYAREKARKIPLNKLKDKWADEFEEYEAIEDTKQRTAYRKANPEIDAKFFIVGRFTTLRTPQAKQHVLRLMEENKIKPEDVRGYENVFGTITPATTQGAKPANDWETIKPSLNLAMLKGLERLWYQGGTLTESEESQLKKVHESHNLGQSNYSIWVKQTLRQAWENSMQ